MNLLTCTWLATSALFQDPGLTHGPLRGHTDATTMHVWARASAPGRYTLRLRALRDGTDELVHAEADAAHDLTLHFAARDLEPGAYDVAVLAGERVVHQGLVPFTTGVPDHANAAVVAFGSCSSDQLQKDQPIWGRMLMRVPQALVLLGDTPYIDAGTTAARQRRHREFFAFPPVRATLATIPTWTTWDDHDYTANDEFGDVTGAGTARPVFVDYHAHAHYGDGSTGIWTSFRTGPIEVFLLDARSQADREGSPLAPGERSLLGSTQLAWLQRGLLASTAPIKVLASGMVWNGGVRAGKQDHWGRWSAERDGLFRWLGAQRIAGVVLVSGDVHRSRVILHPTRAQVGYDLPEFVTSPLAQGVIETNAVPVPGLVFDAGEPSSCLFLAVARDGDECVLHATFQAGDGREFHHRVIPGAQLALPDAATAYRRALESLRARFGAQFEELPSALGNGDLPLGAGEGNGPAWRDAVRRTAPVLAELQALAPDARCRFRAQGPEPLSTEFQELAPGLRALLMLRMAAGMQAIADGDQAAWLRIVDGLLASARHCEQEPAQLAIALADVTERVVLDLRGLAKPRFGDAGDAALRERVRSYCAGRADLGAVGAALRIETFRLFDGFVAQLQLGSDGQAQVARRFAAELRREFVTATTPLFTATDGLRAELSPESRTALREALRGIAEKARADRAAVQALEGATEVSANAAALVARQIAAMAVPNVERAFAQRLETTLLLRALLGD